MTKRKFYIIKTLVAIGLSVFIYFFIELYFIKNKITDEQKPSVLEFGIIFLSEVVSSIIFLIGIRFLFNYQRPELPEEIEEEKREEEEELKKEWESLKETLPLLEITLSTNEKIKGKFLEKDKYFEEVETENKYYKSHIIKIEKTDFDKAYNKGIDECTPFPIPTIDND